MRDLLREPMPEGSRLVVLSRTERIGKLRPPSRTLKIELKPFSLTETACLLRTKYPDASDSEVDEFHSLTSHNPRVQSRALERSGPISNILLSLGPNPSSVNDTIEKMLDDALTELHDNIGENELKQVDSLCTALAVLSPFIPIRILASISGTEVSAVRSFASDLGGSLLVIGDAVQFQDEPVETWFRTTFKPNNDKLAEFISNLQVFATESAYVAYSLPQLMLDAGQLNELIGLALNPRLLPGNEIEKRNVMVQRLQFALRASLKACRYLDAAKLAMKAALETAGDSRRWEMFQYNTDLASRFLSSHQIREIVSRRKFKNKWIGSRFAYEAGLLSGGEENKGETLNRLRIVDEWIAYWGRLSKEEKQEGNRIEAGDIAEIALARLNVVGPQACSDEISRWEPKIGQYRIGCVVAGRLIDQGRIDHLNSLARISSDNVYLLLAINDSFSEILKRPQRDVAEFCLNMLQYGKFQFSQSGRESESPSASAITALVETACSYSLSTAKNLSLLLKKYLPPVPPLQIVSMHSQVEPRLLRSYALIAALDNVELNLRDLAHPNLRTKLDNKEKQSDDSDVREFEKTVGGLLPWYKLWASLCASSSEQSEPEDIMVTIDKTLKLSKSRTGVNIQESYYITDRIALIWFEILVRSRCNNETALLKFKNWIDNLKRPLYVPTLIKLARLACHADGFENLVYGFLKDATRRIESANEDAKSMADSYLGFSKVILGFDEPESKQYFQKAVDVASKIGDEIYSRWKAMIHLGEQASEPGQPDPELAYLFSRCAELTDKYLYDHLDYDSTVEVIAGLCPSSCFAVLSRWPERRFGDSKRLLVTAVNYLSEHQQIDIKAVASLVCFRGYWDYDKLLNDIKEAGYSSSDQQSLLNHLFYYMKFGEHPAASWETFRDLVNERNVDFHNLDHLIYNSQHREAAENNSTNTSDLNIEGKDQDVVDWGDILGDLHLHLPHGLSKAHSNYKQSPTRRVSREQFIVELVRRIPSIKAVEFIKTYSYSNEFDLYELKVFLEALPRTWYSRLAVKTALAELVVKYCDRYCMEVSRGRYYQSFPTKLIYDATGMSESELMGHVLNAIGKRDVKVDSDQLYTIVGLVVPKLSSAEARNALVFGINQFDEAMTDDVGDGPLRQDLLPPVDVNKALAGYIWSALAAPQSSLRWETAHVVRGICNLEIRDIFDHLIDFANEGSPIPFVDSKLQFYRLHAKQWLMIALARASQDKPSFLVPIKDYLIEVALHNEPHVLVRHFAARTVLNLVEHGDLVLDGDVVNRLVSVNKSDLPVVFGNSSVRYRNPKDKKPAECRFYFGIDMPAYWFNALSRCFGLTSHDISIEADKIILDNWELSDDNRWESDARNRLGYFENGETSHSHGSYPKADDLRFYLSYHSMMIVAGQLLATNSTYRDTPESEDEFVSWLEDKALTHSDGRWLSDRRDTIQTDRPAWKDQKIDDNWRWSVSRDDFNQVLGLGSSYLNLAGSWNVISGEYEEVTRVYSALVTPNRSLALLKALQTSINPYFSGLPYAGDNREIDCDDFKLKGWVEDLDPDSGLDNLDPWSGSVKYPPIIPASFVCDLLGLEPELKDSRVWKIRNTDATIWSYVWGTNKTTESEGENGRCLKVSRDLLSMFLSKTEMDLIVEVQIERKKQYYYMRNESEELERMYPYFKLFVISSNGQTHSF